MRLTEANPDVRGVVRLDMTDVPRDRWRSLRERAQTYGWLLVGFDYEFHSTYWRLARRGVTVVGREDPNFVTGPSLAELRRYPQARTEAEKARHELGVDPLSDIALEEAKRKHLALWRSAVRWAGTSAVSGLVLLVLLLAGWRLMLDGGADSAIVIGVAVVLASVLAWGWATGARKLSARKAAVHAYTSGYERVVSAVLDHAGRPDTVHE